MNLHTISQQFADHEQQDAERYEKLTELIEKQAENTAAMAAAIEPLITTMQWLTATGRFAGWIRPIILFLITLAGAWVAIKKLFL